MLSDAAVRLAAKFRNEPDSSDEGFHPLVCHLADVAAVARSMWQGRLGERVRARLADDLGLTLDQAGRWVAFLAGLHDVGKACPAFQRKDPAAMTRIGDLLPLEKPHAAVIPGHGSVSGRATRLLLEARFQMETRASRKLGLVLAGHHGLFPVDVEQAHGVAIGEPRGTVSQWNAVRAELFDALATLLEIDTKPTLLIPNPAAMIIAGIISVTDWIGSSEQHFAWNPNGPSDLEGYFRSTSVAAESSLREMRWKPPEEPSAPRSFQTLFHFEPRPLQQVTQRLRILSDTPGLVIIEAPMGEGKTEAALLLADHWNAQGFQGAYVALPTQATANQLHGRVARFLAERFRAELGGGDDVNLLLVHGGTFLRDLDLLPSGVDDGDGPREGAVAAGEWFLARKRSLLAPYGVGTIDQSLMAVLQVKHVFVRLFGLAGKVVVIDEVHAYDTYMTGLLERLLEWLAALGSPVVLLSATLPTSRRRALLQAYARGLTSSREPAGRVPDCPYPRVTWLEGGQPRAESFPAAERSRRTLQLGRVEDSPDAVRDLLVRELAGGGCAAVICNTVARAQETYLALQRAFPADELGLFHARYLLKDRMTREDECLRRFGPPLEDGTSPNRPRRYVLVATQVIEQSLDLDFDLMVTDLAPIDLLLQRSGRLQRHERGQRAHPLRLWVRWPVEADRIPRLDRPSTFVYDAHVLLRTWWLLRDRDALMIPDAVQACIDAVYSDDEPVRLVLHQELEEFWLITRAEMDEKRAAERREALDRRLRAPSGSALLTDFVRHPREEDAPDLHPAFQAVTRLAEPSIAAVVIDDGSPLIPEEDDRLSRDRVKALLLHSINISAPRGVQALRTESPPAAFAVSSALRRHRLVRLDSTGRAVVGDVTFTYHPDLGLTIARSEGGR